ncbi:anti-sigma factor [Vibrio phage EniLVp02]
MTQNQQHTPNYPLPTVVRSASSDELAKDIFAFAMLLIRLDCDHILENQMLLAEVLNESGFRTVTGKRFTKQSFNMFLHRITPQTKAEIMDEFGDALHLMTMEQGTGINPIGAAMSCPYV